jgi:hypothetical protein
MRLEEWVLEMIAAIVLCVGIGVFLVHRVKVEKAHTGTSRLDMAAKTAGAEYAHYNNNAECPQIFC